MGTERYDTVIIGGGQAGLTAGYYATRRGQRVLILDGSERVGEAWRRRWDSLRLFTPGRFNGLPGMPFPGSKFEAPTKDEMADYLEAYAARFDLPVRLQTWVRRLSRRGDSFVIETSGGVIEAASVIVATGSCSNPWTPAFASELDPRIVQLHSNEYVNRAQLQDGPVLIVGAGNSGADIGMDVIRSHPVTIAGRDTGHVPFRIDTFKARFLVPVVRFVGHHVLTRRWPGGRKALAKLENQGNPLVRIKPKDLLAAGIERVGKVTGVTDGKPVLDDGRVLSVANVIWCTGFRPDLSWIDLPVVNEEGKIINDRGLTPEPGLAFLGFDFQFAATSETITGVSRDAAYVVKHLGVAGAERPVSARLRLAS